MDLILGDPRWLPHPIRWMGKWIESWEPCYRRLPFHQTLSGALFALTLFSGTWIITWGGLKAVNTLSPSLETLLQVILIYYALSVRSLRDAAMEVYGEIKSGTLQEAKEKLTFIVGREVEPLDDKGVARATVETVAENLVDGILSPLFFASIGGAPLAMTFKMINTLDSMIGYKNERYRHFGKGAARLDDLANYIPARLSVLMITLSAFLIKGHAGTTLTTALKEGKNHLSPNAGYSEAAFAGALKIRLGGPNYYHGNLVQKPYIGSQFGDSETEHILQACDLMILSALIGLILFWGVKCLLI